MFFPLHQGLQGFPWRRSTYVRHRGGITADHWGIHQYDHGIHGGAEETRPQHNLYTIYTLYIHYIYTIYTLYIYTHTLYIHYIYIYTYTIYIHSIYTLYIHIYYIFNLLTYIGILKWVLAVYKTAEYISSKWVKRHKPGPWELGNLLYL